MWRGEREVRAEWDGRKRIDRARFLGHTHVTTPAAMRGGARTFCFFFFFLPVGDAGSGSGTTNVVARSWIAYTHICKQSARSPRTWDVRARAHLQPRIRHGCHHVVRLLLNEVLSKKRQLVVARTITTHTHTHTYTHTHTKQQTTTTTTTSVPGNESQPSCALARQGRPGGDSRS